MKRLIVFDIDDTLLHANCKNVCIYKHPNGDYATEVALSTKQFAVDPDADIHPDWFDMRDFRDTDIVYNSIMSGRPCYHNLQILDKYINEGYDFTFLTARGCEKTVRKAISDFLMYRDLKGNLKPIGRIFKKRLAHAISDERYNKTYPKATAAEKKSIILKKLCNMYDNVVFVDDDEKNINAATELNLQNLIVIKAK